MLKRQERQRSSMLFPVRPSPHQGFASPLHSPLVFLSSFEPLVSIQLHLTFARFDGARDDTLHIVLHEFVEEDKWKELALKSFRSPPPINTKDVKVNPLQMIFNLKRVLVGKDYFKINHFLPLSFNLAWGCTLLGKNIVPRPTLKQFLLRCLKQFTVYIWRSTLLAKMKAYLRKIVEVTGIKINLHMIMG